MESGELTFGVLCNYRIHIMLKENFYKTTLQSPMLYGPECWVITKQHVEKVRIVEMIMLR